MADSRLTGTHRVGAEPQRNLTFRIDGSTITYDSTQPGGSAVVGRAVGLKAGTAGQVELVADAQMVLGLLYVVEPDGGCGVTVEGVVRLPGGDTPPTSGKRIVGATLSAARGYVRAAAAAPGTYAAATADEIAAARGIVFDATTSTAIEVLL